MKRTTTTLALLALAGSAGIAHAQVFIPMNAHGKNYNEGRSNTAAEGIVTFEGRRDNGDPVAGLWDWKSDTFHEMPQPTDDLGNAVEFNIFQFRQAPDRGPGDPVKGIIIGPIRKPTNPNAAVWNTTEGLPGHVNELQNAQGVGSWSTSGSIGGTVIGGALYGDLDGNGVSRHAAVWLDGGDAQLLPVPTGTRSSEIWDVTASGEFACGWASESNEPRPSPLEKTADKIMNAVKQLMSSGIVQVVEPDVADAESMMFTQLTPDGNLALSWSVHADNTTKGGLYDFGAEHFTLLDGGDINGDGQIDLHDFHNSDALAVSDDGSVIGGSYTLPGGPETAAFWTADDGYQMHDLAAYLQDQGVLGLDGWHLTSITGVSADGTVFSGSGYDPSGFADVWVAVIPSPASISILSLAGLTALRRRRAD